MADRGAREGGPRTAPGLAAVVATLSRFCDGSGAVSVTVVIDQGEGVLPAVVSYDPAEGSVEVSEGDESRTVPDASALGDADPVAALHLHSFPPFEVDLDAGTVTGAIGALEHQARSVIDLASAFGGRSVASAFFASDRDQPLEVGGSADGEVSLSCGEAEFEAPAGWPGR